MITDTKTIWQKHFGDIPGIGLFSDKIEAFFEDLNQACLEEMRQHDATLNQQHASEIDQPAR